MSRGGSCDVVVVGARVAGATVASLLGDQGHSVLLVDRARFPSPVPSTHFFRGAGLVSVLDRLGVLDEVLALGSPPLVREYRYVDGSAEAKERPPQNPGDFGYCLSVRRSPLDRLLLERACASSTVGLREGARVTGILWRNGRAAGVHLAGPDGEDVVEARLVVGADGRHSQVARWAGAADEEEPASSRPLYYRYFRRFSAPDGREPDAAEFSLSGDEMAYVFPSDDGVTCVAVSINRAEFARMRTAVEHGFDGRVAGHAGVAPRVRAATPVSRVLGTGPGTAFLRVPHGPGWALVGDAGMHSDPFAGLGMDMAATHATFLADAVDAWLAGDRSEDDALRTYHERRNATGVAAYREVTLRARDLRQPA